MQQPGSQQGPAPPRVKPLTTVEIQQMLEENAKLIQAVVDNQNLNRMEDCVMYSKKLQENLMHLAALADAQAVPATQPAQLPSGAGQ